MKVKSNIITRATVGEAVRKAGVSFIDTNAREGWFEPIREFKPRTHEHGFEFFLTGSSKYAAAHQSAQGGYEREKAATWDEWGLVIEALYDVDPDAVIGYYTSRADFIAKTRAEATRIATWNEPDGYQARTHRAPWLAREDAREHRVQFGTLTPESLQDVREIRQSDIRACPFVIFTPDHYREDGSCKCDDPAERARMIADWGYAAEQFAGIALREEVAV